MTGDAELSAKTYELSRPSALRTYLAALVFAVIAVSVIITGPLPLKLFFGYVFLGNIWATFANIHRSVALKDKELHVRAGRLLKIPYSDISGVNLLPLKNTLARLLAVLSSGRPDSQVRIALRRVRWTILPFPIPIIIPTKDLLLSLTDGSSFAAELAGRLQGANQ